MSVTWVTIVHGAGALLAAVAAVLWLWASLITVPDNLDTFVKVLQSIGRLNAYGAAAASGAALCGLVLFLNGMR